MRFLIFFITFLILSTWSFSQNNCVENLKKAEDAFDAGRIEEIPALLNSCIRSDFDKEQKALAYRLLTITYLYDKDEEKAEEAMLHLLRTDPLFKPDISNDPSEFISLYNSFRTNPIMIAGFSVGGMLFYIRDVSRFGVENLTSETEKYSGNWGVDLGFDVEIPVKKNWSVYSSLHFSSKKYSIENTLMSFNELQVNESQSWVDLYLMGQYNFTEMKTRPFIRLGGYAGSLISAQAVYLTNQEDLNDIEGPSEDITQLRTTFNYGWVGDLGLSHSFGRNIIDLTLRYCYVFKNYVNEESRGGPLENSLALTYGYRDNDFQANFMSATIGYKIMIFKPKKLY